MRLPTGVFVVVSMLVCAESLSASPFSYLSVTPYNSAATAVSADGAVVVGNSNSAKGPQAFRWTWTDAVRSTMVQTLSEISDALEVR